MTSFASRRLVRATATAVMLWSIAGSASAQYYGQWTWDARISARQRSHEFMESQQVVSEMDDRDTFLSLGLNGFVLHPAIAAFRLGIDTGLTQREGGTGVGSRKLGYRGDLRVFPTGAYPAHLYMSRQSYDYGDESSAVIGSVPDEITTFGARLRVRSGPLTGLVARSEHSRIRLAGPRGGVESQQYQLADWAGGSKAWRHHYRLERQARVFGVSGYRNDDISLFADNSRRSAQWQFISSSQLVRRGWSSASTGGSSLTALRVQNRLLRTRSGASSWELDHSSGITLGDDTSQSHTLGVRYSLTTRQQVSISPFANVGTQISDALRVFAPQAGVSVSWNVTRGAVNAHLSGSAASLLLNTDGASTSTRETSLSSGAGISLAFRPRRGPHSQLEGWVSRNELRRSGETITASSVLMPIGGAGTEDRTQARFSFGRTWKPFGLHFYADWVSQSSSGDLQVNPYSAETLSSTLQVTLRRISVSMSTGNATLLQGRQQELRFVTAAARLPLFKTTSLAVNHRQERRVFIGEPEVDGTHTEAGLSLRLGSYTIEPQAFASTQSSIGPERSNRGFTLMIGRAFGGFLPIVSGVQRRGVVQ